METNITIFDPFYAELAEAEAYNASLKFDYEDKAGNKEARSHVAKIRKLKAPITEAHKTAKANALEVCRVLDAKKNELISRIDAMVEIHAAPLKAIEDREKAEIERIQREQEEQRIAEQKRLDEQRLEQERKERELKEREESIARQEREKEIAAQAAKEAEERAKADAARMIRAAEERAENERKRAEQAEQERAKAEADAKARFEADEARKRECLEAAADCLNEILDNVEQARTIALAIQAGYIKHVVFTY